MEEVVKKSLEELDYEISNAGVFNGQRYKHIKSGDFYTVISLVVDCNTNELVVIYAPATATTEVKFCRPLKEWNELLPDGVTKRFELLKIQTLEVTDSEFSEIIDLLVNKNKR